MSQAVLMVKQRSPVKGFLAEFGGEGWADAGGGVEKPDENVDAAGGGEGQKQQEIADGGGVRVNGNEGESNAAHVFVFKNPKKTDLRRRGKGIGTVGWSWRKE
jgi:hypothetical protein